MRVSFAPIAAVQCTIHIDDFTDEERDAYWIGHYEKAQARKLTQEILSKLSKGEKVKPCCCLRGLEFYAHEKMRRRRFVRQEAAFAVFAAQERQHQQGYTSDNEISLAYGVYTFQSQQEAFEMGIADRIDCEESYGGNLVSRCEIMDGSRNRSRNWGLRIAKKTDNEINRQRHLFPLAALRWQSGEKMKRQRPSRGYSFAYHNFGR